MPHSMHPLTQWIADLNALQTDAIHNFVFVHKASSSNHRHRTFLQLLRSFRDFKAPPP